MKNHEVVCDGCRRKAPLEYNGEHWLIPRLWVAIWCDHQAHALDIHLCDNCKPQPIKKKHTGAKETKP
jgi:hypothetical protein